MNEWKMIVIEKVYEALSLPDVISIRTRSECVDGQSAGSILYLGQSHVSCKEKALIKTQTGKMHQVLLLLS